MINVTKLELLHTLDVFVGYGVVHLVDALAETVSVDS